jgi:hypothetical protein
MVKATIDAFFVCMLNLGLSLNVYRGPHNAHSPIIWWSSALSKETGNRGINDFALFSRNLNYHRDM